MIDGPILIALSLTYVSALFLLAWAGDRVPALREASRKFPFIFALSVAVYCTSWTFYGSVGLAASTGIDFLPVYTGAIFCFLFCTPLIQRIVRLAKNQNITSVADFLAARHGKSQTVAAVAAIITVIGTLPYIALQLKAVSLSVQTVIGTPAQGFGWLTVDTGLIVAAGMALFAVLFGTRHADATEHQHGLMLAIATESLIKLAAFLAVGVFIVVSCFSDVWKDPGAAFALMAESPQIQAIIAHPMHGSFWLTVSILSFIAVLLLPRQFHVVVVENTSDAEIRRAKWFFPLYLVLINLFVIPIAVAGLLTLPVGAYSPDSFVLALPLAAKAPVMTMIAFIGGLSAATAMVVVDTVALAVMVCNGLIAPLLLRTNSVGSAVQKDMVGRLLAIRRFAILAIMALAYAFYLLLGRNEGLASIGLVSFAGIAQLAPAFFIGLYWRNATARGALVGMTTGICIWAYTLVLPWFADAGIIGSELMTRGPFGLEFLVPQALFHVQMDHLSHGVMWSLAVNSLAYIGVSLWRPPMPVERLQSHVFVTNSAVAQPVAPAFRMWRSSITVGDLQTTVARYLGAERAARSFRDYAERINVKLDATAEADLQTVRFGEHLLTSAIGAASARLVLSLLLRRGAMAPTSALRLLDDASEALQHNRDLLQSALDQVRHGLSVFDKDLRLVCWNKQFRELLDLPAEMGRFGVPLADILLHCAKRGDFGPGKIDELVSTRLMKLAIKFETFIQPLQGGRQILEIRTSAMPQGGIVTTYSDITGSVAAAEELARANETLERRVADRTAELSHANAALAAAKANAEAASVDKTRFLAAASHDILQPLNAARLYSSSLIEQQQDDNGRQIASKIDQSLDAVEEIIGTVLEIARLDTSRMEADITALPIAEIFERLAVEFEPLARERGLELVFVPSSLWVHSDRRLLPRLMQNLVSNAIKYTPAGRVLVGARRGAFGVKLEVVDTGPGIAPEQLALIFKEFQRLPATAGTVRGLGLGLSIVERVAKVLDHRVDVVSRVGRGSTFSVTMPVAAPGVVARQAAPLAVDVHAGQLAGLTVLCIDNEPSVLEGMQTLLAGWRCKAVVAANVAAAISALGTASVMPDVVLADYHLDEGTGLDAIQAIRQWVGRPVPALVITAETSAELQRTVRDAGFGFLRKPVKVAALRAALTHLLRQSANNQSANNKAAAAE